MSVTIAQTLVAEKLKSDKRIAEIQALGHWQVLDAERERGRGGDGWGLVLLYFAANTCCSERWILVY